MKLFGGAGKKSTHIAGTAVSGGGKKKKKKKGRVFLVLLIVLLCLAVAAAGVWFLYVRPPEIVRERLSFLYPTPAITAEPTPEVTQEPSPEPTDTPEPELTPEPEDTPEPEITPEPEPREDYGDDLQYTFAVLGIDKKDNYADFAMICDFDLTEQRLNTASFPADTLANEVTGNEKLSSVYGTWGTDAMCRALSRISGYTFDFYVTVEMDAFSQLVDALGGVEFEVPMDMHYEDPEQDLVIDLKKGMQTLNGDTALQLVRFRTGYEEQRLGRIDTQHDFLFSVIGKLIREKKDLDLSALAKTFISCCDTDLTYGNVIWLCQQFFAMDDIALNFLTPPGEYREVGEERYFVIDPEKWTALLNQYLSPFADDFVPEELGILGIDGETGELTSTNGIITSTLPMIESENPDEAPWPDDPYIARTPEPKRAPEIELEKTGRGG